MWTFGAIGGGLFELVKSTTNVLCVWMKWYTDCSDNKINTPK